MWYNIQVCEYTHVPNSKAKKLLLRRLIPEGFVPAPCLNPGNAVCVSRFFGAYSAKRQIKINCGSNTYKYQ